MNNKFLLTAIAVGFWSLVIILCVPYFNFSNYFKIREERKNYKKTFNNRLQGVWMRTTDSLKIEYINHPTNAFLVLNDINYVEDYDTTIIKKGFEKIDDISITDTINNVYDVSYLANNSKTYYFTCDLILLNDSTMIIKHQQRDMSETFTKIK